MEKVVELKSKKNVTGKEWPESEDKNKERVYQLRISLVESKPEIWRRVLVPGKTNLGKLHRIIQIVMGWTDSHLHEFIVKKVSYADPNPDMEMDDSKNEKKAYLFEIAPTTRSSFLYMYDFGDGWEHKIKVEKIMDNHDRFSGKPVCLEGERACPLEDCGGIYGYYDLLEVLKNPGHPDYEDMEEWAGDNFDPTGFDVDEVNILLKKMR